MGNEDKGGPETVRTVGGEPKDNEGSGWVDEKLQY